MPAGRGTAGEKPSKCIAADSICGYCALSVIGPLTVAQTFGFESQTEGTVGLTEDVLAHPNTVCNCRVTTNPRNLLGNGNCLIVAHSKPSLPRLHATCLQSPLKLFVQSEVHVCHCSRRWAARIHSTAKAMTCARFRALERGPARRRA